MSNEPWFQNSRERALYVAFVVAISTRVLALIDGLVAWTIRRYLTAQ